MRKTESRARTKVNVVGVRQDLQTDPDINFLQCPQKVGFLKKRSLNSWPCITTSLTTVLGSSEDATCNHLERNSDNPQKMGGQGVGYGWSGGEKGGTKSTGAVGSMCPPCMHTPMTKENKMKYTVNADLDFRFRGLVHSIRSMPT